jgi:hypothetical protein
MIARNDAGTLPRLAATMEGRIDRWTIVDTGSTDATPQVARAAFGDLPGELIQDQWRGFGPSRYVALQAAERHSDWLLNLDADETIHGDLSVDWLGDEVEVESATPPSGSGCPGSSARAVDGPGSDERTATGPSRPARL